VLVTDPTTHTIRAITPSKIGAYQVIYPTQPPLAVHNYARAPLSFEYFIMPVINNDKIHWS